MVRHLYHMAQETGKFSRSRSRPPFCLTRLLWTTVTKSELGVFPLGRHCQLILRAMVVHHSLDIVLT